MAKRRIQLDRTKLLGFGAPPPRPAAGPVFANPPMVGAKTPTVTP